MCSTVPRNSPSNRQMQRQLGTSRLESTEILSEHTTSLTDYRSTDTSERSIESFQMSTDSSEFPRDSSHESALDSSTRQPSQPSSSSSRDVTTAVQMPIESSMSPRTSLDVHIHSREDCISRSLEEPVPEPVKSNRRMRTQRKVSILLLLLFVSAALLIYTYFHVRLSSLKATLQNAINRFIDQHMELRSELFAQWAHLHRKLVELEFEA